MRHYEFMAIALEEARLAADHGEIPVGAVLVKDGKIIARGHNRRVETGDPTAHAEVLVLQEAGKRTGDWRLEEHDYVRHAGALPDVRWRNRACSRQECCLRSI